MYVNKNIFMFSLKKLKRASSWGLWMFCYIHFISPGQCSLGTHDSGFEAADCMSVIIDRLPRLTIKSADPVAAAMAEIETPGSCDSPSPVGGTKTQQSIVYFPYSGDSVAADMAEAFPTGGWTAVAPLEAATSSDAHAIFLDAKSPRARAKSEQPTTKPRRKSRKILRRHDSGYPDRSERRGAYVRVSPVERRRHVSKPAISEALHVVWGSAHARVSLRATSTRTIKTMSSKASSGGITGEE